MLDPVFGLTDMFLHTAAPRCTAFIASAIRELQAPKSLAERNLAQLLLAKRVSKQFELEITAAVEAVAPLYAAKFPKPQPKPRLLKRLGNASIEVTDFPH